MRYKNVSTNELVIPNVGIVKPNDEIESSEELNNPNLKLVKAKEKPVEK